MRPSKPGTSLLNRNNIWLGLVIGICLPVMFYGVSLWLLDIIDNNFLPPDTSISRGFRERTLSVLAICSNLIPFHIYQRKFADNTMRGLIFPTIAYVFAWFWIYGRHLVGLA